MRKTLVTIALGALMALGTANAALAQPPADNAEDLCNWVEQRSGQDLTDCSRYGD